jgi:hypothetical protein
MSTKVFDEAIKQMLVELYCKGSKVADLSTEQGVSTQSSTVGFSTIRQMK